MCHIKGNHLEEMHPLFKLCFKTVSGKIHTKMKKFKRKVQIEVGMGQINFKNRKMKLSATKTDTFVHS